MYLNLFDAGLRADQKSMMIRNLPAIATAAVPIDKAKAMFPAFYAYLKSKGWDDGKFLNLSCASAFAGQAVWSNHDQAWTAPCVSRIGVYFGQGDWLVSYPIPKAHGQYIGEGPQTMYYNNWAATCFKPWHDNWQGDTDKPRCSMLSTSWGIEGNGGYTEGSSVDKIGFVGNNSGWWNSAYEEHGLCLWDEGEVTSDGIIYARDHNGYGVLNARGTPFTCKQLSVFTNALGGLGLIGCELNTMNLGTISGDDNPALIVQRAGYGRGSGGAISFALGKCESGKRTPNKGQIVLWQRDPSYSIINVNVSQMDMNGPFVDAAFVMNTKAASGGQILTCLGRAWNFRTIVHDVANKKRWAGGAYVPFHFTWSSMGGGKLVDHTTAQQVPATAVNASDRLGLVPNNGTFDYVNGLPVYDITGGTPPVQPPITPVPPVDPPVPPPGGSTTVWSGGSVSATTVVHLVTPITTTKVTVTNLKTTALSYGRLLGTGAGKPSIQLYPDGFFYLNNAKVSASKVVSGVAWSGVLTVPSTTFTDVWQTDPAQGGAIVCTCDKVVLG